VAQPTGWGNLSGDVTRIVMSKVPLEGLARAAIMSREFNDAYLSEATAKRADLITLGEDFYGTGRSGLCPRSSLLGEDEIASPSDLGNTNVVITNKGAFLLTSLTDEARKIIVSDGNFGIISATASASHLFHCMLWPQKTKHITWDMYRVGRNGIYLKVYLERNRLLPHMSSVQNKRTWATLGLVVATCMGHAGALPAAPQSAFTTDLTFHGLSDGMAGVREAQDMIASLRPQADSVMIDHYVKIAPFVSNRRMQSRPFGALVVRVR
jgi:hypothetical protein